MNVEFGAEAALFPEKEYINGIADAVYCEFSSNQRGFYKLEVQRAEKVEN